MPLPYFACPISAGYPSPAQDYTESTIDLNAHLVRNPSATFFMRVVGDTMQSAGVHGGDILVVDRSLKPRSGDTVVAHVDGELFIRRPERYGDRLCLVAASSDSPPMVTADSCELWGVVTFIIHALR